MAGSRELESDGYVSASAPQGQQIQGEQLSPNHISRASRPAEPPSWSPPTHLLSRRRDEEEEEQLAAWRRGAAQTRGPALAPARPLPRARRHLMRQARPSRDEPGVTRSDAEAEGTLGPPWGPSGTPRLQPSFRDQGRRRLP